MNWNFWIRQTHRWFSIILTVAIIVNGIAVSRRHYTNTLGLFALIPLAVLLLTGLYLFFLPYFPRRRASTSG